MKHRRIVVGLFQGVTGTTLIELLSSMAILTVLLSVLAVALQASLGQFRSSLDQSQSAVNSQQAISVLKEDLRFAASSFPSNLPPLPPEVDNEQRDFFESRVFFPFEVNRNSGLEPPLEAGFPARNQNYSTLAFTRLSHIDRPVGNSSRLTTGYPSLALIGYYVAFTKDAPSEENVRYSMKLFRHFRPAGNFGEGYADGFLRYCHREINDAFFDSTTRSELPIADENLAAVLQGKFDNHEIPFLLSGRLIPDGNSNSPELSNSLPWPEFTSPPTNYSGDLGTEQSWSDSENAVHDLILPDEAIAKNVVRFEVTAFRILENASGVDTLMTGPEVVQILNLTNFEEWPSLVIPTYLEVTLGVIDEEIAVRLEAETDWNVDWTEGATPRSDLEELVKSNTQIQSIRITIGSGY
ncbi:MAG: hypothetical protein AAF357_19740 [Verrucomicrobiota bacterium]